MSFDPNFDDVSLLLHCDSNFTDTGPLAQSVSTLNGTPAFSTSIKKFGSASFDARRTGSVLVPAGMDFGAGDFTVECWANWSTASGSQQYGLFQLSTASGYSSSQQSVAVFANTGSTYGFYFDGLVSTSESITTGAWVHIAIARESGTVRFFVDGVKIHEITSTYNFTNAAGVIGGYYSSAFNADALLDDFRVTPGVARYTADFTPPAAAFPDTGPPPLVEVRAAADTMLGAPSVYAFLGKIAFVKVSTPLAAPSVLARAITAGYASDGGPLRPPSSVLAQFVPQARASAPAVIGAPAVLGYIPIMAQAKAATMLGTPALLALHDFTAQVGSSVTRYVMDLTTPSGKVRLPISSWQATLQTGISNYVQCVIPACLPFVSAIESATAFTIYRRAHTSSGLLIEYAMAEAPATSRPFDKGPSRYTCTLSGYAPGFDAGTGDPSAAYNRTLQGVRSISTTDTSIRARAAIDWLLRPGHRCTADGVDFVVSFINYYVGNGDAYMDCGGAK